MNNCHLPVQHWHCTWKQQLLSLENSEKLWLRGRSSEAQVPVDNVEEREDGGEDDDAGVVYLGQPGLFWEHP